MARGFAMVLCLTVMLGIAQAAPLSVPTGVSEKSVVASQKEKHVWMTAGGQRFAITLADNDEARAFAAQLPLTLDMSELNGNEKHGALPQALSSAHASQPATIRNGDVMLYGANTIVVFYETFRSAYAYTRLGTIDEPGVLARVLGSGSVQVVFSAD